jgi:cation transporter-like permease
MKLQRSTKRLGWLLMFISLLGAIIGFVSGGAICSAVLHAHGRGESHADILPVVASAIAGTFTCAVAFPVTVFLIVRNRGL